MRIPRCRRRSWRSRLACCVWLACGLPAAGVAEVAVTGLELRVEDGRERVSVFAQGPLSPRLVELEDRTVVMLVLPGAVLGPGTPDRIAPTAPGAVRRIAAFDTPMEAGQTPEVRVVVHRRPGPPPRLDRGARSVHVDFEPARARREGTKPVRIAYQRVPLKRFVTDIARATGETLVFDDSLSGTLTVEGPERVDASEALALLDSALLLRGYAALPSPGGGRVIVPLAGATPPWNERGELGAGDAPVSTLLRLRTVDAADVASVLQPYVGSSAVLQPFAPSNSVILSGPGARLRRLADLIRTLDGAEPTRTLIWPLYHADAETVAEQLEELLDADELPVVSTDLRHNALLLALRPDAIERARRAVDRLDRPALSRGGLHVVRLRHADPEILSQQLQDLRGAGSADGVGAAALARGGIAGLDFHSVADPPTRSLVLRAAPEALSSVLDVVRELDREPARVRVKVMVASVTLSEQLDLGIDYLIPTLTNPKDPTDLIAQVSSRLGSAGAEEGGFTASFTRSPIVVTVLDAGNNPVPIINPLTGLPLEIPRESVSLTAREGDVRTELLIRPELLASSGQEHRVFAGDNVPIPVERAVEGQVSTQLTRDIERQDVGTTLRVTPTVGARGGVTLELAVEVSELSASAAGEVERVGPSLEEISVESLIRLEPGEVAVLATSGQPLVARAETGVPWLKDIPFLGFLFRASTDRAMKRYLLITAEAEVLRDEVRSLAARLEQLVAAGEPDAGETLAR